MLKLPLLTVVLAATISVPAAEPVRVAWTFQAGGKLHDKIRALAVDAVGQVWITGEFADVADFAGQPVTSRGELDFVIARLNTGGKLSWVRTAGGAGIDRGYAVAVDGDGNSYVTGHFQSGTISFGQTTLRNRGDYDVFVVKHNPAGEVVWARGAGGPAYDYGHGIAVDPRGFVYVSGAIRGAGEFDGGRVTAPDSTGPFIAKYSSAGELLWTRHMTGKGGGSAHEIAVDAAGNAFVGGFYSGTATLGRFQLPPPKPRDLFAAKLTAAGEFVWVANGGGTSDGMVSGLAVDGAGNCFLNGMFKGTLRLGAQAFTSAGDNDFYVARLNAAGEPSWAVAAGGPGIDYGLGLAVDAAGRCLITGETTGAITLAGRPLNAIGKRDLYAAKFDSDGRLRWAWQAGGKLNSLSYAAGCGPAGLNVIAGAFSGDLQLGGRSLVSRGSNDIIVVGLREE